MLQIAAAILAVFLYLLYIGLAIFAAQYLVPLGAVAYALGTVWHCGRSVWDVLLAGKTFLGNSFTGKDFDDVPIGPEPAYRHYFFYKAFRDYEQVLCQSWDEMKEFTLRLIETGKKCFDEDSVLFTWPWGVIYFLAMAGGMAAAVLVGLLFALMLGAVLVLCAGITLALAGLLRLVEYGWMSWNRIFLACPHAECYRKMAIPIYQCPDCGSKHSRLLPGFYGLARRRCQCNTSLVTLFLFGRNQLPSECPHCHRPLNEAIGLVRNLHIPLVGGPSAGKTSFLMASMSDLYQRCLDKKVELSFPEKKDQALFERCHREFAHGHSVDKTVAETPDAFLVEVGTPSGNRGLLYVYDAAGELYQQTETLRRAEYYSYTHGVLFLLDPFSLPEVRSDFDSELRVAANQVKPCVEEPQEVYARMISTFQQHPGWKNGLSKIPCAIVVSKSDAFRLDERIQATAPAIVPPSSRLAAMREAISAKAQDPESAAVQQWLQENGGGNLVRSVEKDFQQVRYFYCSALGRLPDGRPSAFKPDKVLEPLTWLLEQYRLRLNQAGWHSTSAKPPRSRAIFATTPARRSVEKNYNRMLVFTLWIAGLLGFAWWGWKALE